MARSGGGRKLGGAESVRTAVVDYGNPAMMHGSKATTSISCKNDGEVLDGLVQTMPSHQFAFARFMGLADVLGCTSLFSLLLYSTCER
jgi:RNA exonuclease 1